ncbi:hypothetical protein JCM8547_004486 [Rhodosporidiobolus lusitaniae]
MLKLYDLCTSSPGGRLFSPFCVRARLALMAKDVPFETVMTTYHELRGYWKERLKDLWEHKPTLPFMELDNGTFIMGSLEIALWLDKEYPDRQNLLLPEAPLPMDVNSREYQDAVKEYKQQKKPFPGGNPPGGDLVFELYAARIPKVLDPQAAAYWTSDEHLGEGKWASVVARSAADEAHSVREIVDTLAQFSKEHFDQGNLFLASPSKPGLKDFAMIGTYRLLRVTSKKLADETWGSPESGEWPNWLERMSDAYPLALLWERDPVE